MKTFQSKVQKKNKNDEESTRNEAFREVLQQLSFQANQHELIGETFGGEYSKEVDQRVVDIRRELKEHKREAKTLENNLEKSYKALDSAKQKYQKSHNEKEEAKRVFEKADTDGSFSRNEVKQLESVANIRDRENDDMKSTYANQLEKTNKLQEEYYYDDLASLLNKLELVYRETNVWWVEMLERCVKYEVGISPIVSKCHDSMLTALSNVDPDHDTNIVVTK